MYIYPVNNNVSMQGKGKPEPSWIKKQIRYVKQKILDMSLSHTSKERTNSTRKWNKSSNFAGNPMWNRGIMGATALITQPAIDYYNHRVDDETRTVSRNRTIAKILAGTLVGMFVVRGPVYKMVKNMTYPIGTKKWNKFLIPKEFLEKLKHDKEAMKNYRSAISMGIALFAMCFTNFLLDAPLTNLLTNYFNKKSNIGIKNDNNKVTSSTLVIDNWKEVKHE